MDALKDPREAVKKRAGKGNYGYTFGPRNKDFQRTRTKATAVLDGRSSFSFVELGRVLAQMLKER